MKEFETTQKKGDREITREQINRDNQKNDRMNRGRNELERNYILIKAKGKRKKQQKLVNKAKRIS
ncbi:MAG TPA: hypothetical protein ENI07_03185 [Desulfobacterales bacterium]|nr:hypothetical protein [Desulfobacterales bacterium]